MTKFRKTIIAVAATAIVATTTVASFDNAQAGPRGMRAHGEMFNGGHRGHRGHRGWGHRRHGGWGNVGTGMAIGLGVAIVGQAIAAAAAEDNHESIHGDAQRDGWTAANQRRHDCYVAREYRKLVKAAKEALDRDIRMHNRNPEYHSIEHVRFARQELQRRRAELKRALARCA